MSYKISVIDNFRREAKRLIKKYPPLKAELQNLSEQLIKHPTSGIPLGNNCYKIRLAFHRKVKGKAVEQELLPICM